MRATTASTPRRTTRTRRPLALAATVLGTTTLALSALTGTAHAAQPQAQPEGARQIAQDLIGDDAQFRCFSEIVERESGWDHTAQNPGSGAYGLVQALPGGKMASAGADWQTNPATQIEWGVEYMEERYGSPCGAWAFWQQNHWY
ncbi:transglycosylase SLT domain-containing protein [Streptomyces sp. TRM 70351]|uniref:aggregation-promoting factor C-terminal-like domain-containing protein n=1 Tax=Streptomyces sp. TRM 70351 TaxID=3116552 RepID=UPI002E7B7C8C|nr:transglycosylase SLT domain-containing protein [Streptomyces sp. TRM 70351]MEE1930644.1 transglycosylase SLT domain-containing protein [Streptomyces sp. TRM 70351]